MKKDEEEKEKEEEEEEKDGNENENPCQAVGVLHHGRVQQTQLSLELAPWLSSIIVLSENFGVTVNSKPGLS
ncbi:hypothetical protein PoB_007050500 [Plakobranchus ocellatus]|uniref:Uncharacterized protein n=1 Tax=Plakobranchus ocellatus TaxID=259542 RepID=A0AAV4DJ40_9GAST|nr:hypothetical protein PoB_007050500 [Plakobranchus ocellatus]